MDYTFPQAAPPAPSARDTSYSSADGPNETHSTTSTMTFALSKRPRTTRAKFPKVRTGCITCKRRHVKCDEAKPSCARCLKWRGSCSGYESEYQRASHTPEPTVDTFGRPASISETPGGTVTPSPALPSDTNSFLHRSKSLPPSRVDSAGAISPLTGPSRPPSPDDSMFDAAFWRETVPRLAEENAAVRSANEAVHILILAKQPSLMSAGARRRPGEDHYGGALRRYGAALREVRQASVSHGGDLRPAILCSMFFVIFEIINGDQKAAEAHLFNGQRMMDELGLGSGDAGADRSASAGTVSGGAGQTKSLRRELKHVLHFLALQARSHGVIRWEREMRTQSGSFAEEFGFGDTSGPS